MLGRPAVQEHRLPLLLRRLDRMVETDELAVGGDYRVTIAQCDAVTGPAVVNIAEWPDLLRTFGSHAAALPMIGPTCRKRLSGDRLWRGCDRQVELDVSELIESTGPRQPFSAGRTALVCSAAEAARDHRASNPLSRGGGQP